MGRVGRTDCIKLMLVTGYTKTRIYVHQSEIQLFMALCCLLCTKWNSSKVFTALLFITIQLFVNANGTICHQPSFEIPPFIKNIFVFNINDTTVVVMNAPHSN